MLASAHAPTPQLGIGVPKTFYLWTFKLQLKIQRVYAYNFRVCGVTSQNFTRRRASRNNDNVGTNFVRTASNTIREGKKRPKFGEIPDSFPLWSQMSLERIDMTKILKVRCQLQPIPYYAKKIRWTLVHKQKSYRRKCWPTQVDFFRKLCISAVRRC